MKVTLSNLGDEFLQDYKLVKKIDNNFINETIEGTVIYEDEKNRYLIEATINGYIQEVGEISYPCGDQTFQKDIKLSHKEGKFDFAKCKAEKSVKFNTPLDCVAEGQTNIFDYTANETETIQGELVTFTYGDVQRYYDPEENDVLNLDFCLNFIGGIPDKSAEGLYPEYVHVYATPIIETVTDEFGTGDLYNGHDIEIFVRYVGLKSAVQHSSLWVEIDGFFYYSNISLGDWKAPVLIIHEERNTLEVVTYFTEKRWERGRFQVYKDVNISNTIDFNEVLTGVFQCTGYSVVSNFFGIAADGSNPQNKYYEYATNNYHNLRIVQSYDIIRENELEDSFGRSGTFENKDFIIDICTLFNIVIYPDVTNSTIRIEHISYYTTKGIDVTLEDYEIDEFNLNADQIDKETWQMAQPTPSDGFYETSITYRTLDLFKEENEKIRKTKLLITDVFGTLNNADYESEEYKKLFFLLATDGTSIIELNDSLSMTNIVNRLHDLNRPLKTGFINGNQVQFTGYSIGLSSELKMFSSPIMWDNLSPMYSVITKYGTFLIEEIEIDNKNLLTLKIKK